MGLNEIEVMKRLDELFVGLDDEPRQRVLAWVVAKFLSVPLNGPSAGRGLGGEIPGIAVLKQGELELLFHDLKATSAVDAAVRLAHVVLFAHERLTGEKSASSRKVLVPILRQWRLYDGNARSRLAACHGILRIGDRLSLDTPAKRYAEEVMKDILDEDRKGRWQPSVMGRRINRGRIERRLGS